MNQSDACSLVTPAPGGVLGPAEVYASIGHWNTAVYSILVLHALPVWGLAAVSLCRLPARCPAAQLLPTASLVCLPPALLALTSAAIISPSLGTYIEVALEIVICFGLVTFMRLCVLICGGKKNVVSLCEKGGVRLPVGSPPLVCLLPCTKPEISLTNLRAVMAAPLLLLGVKIAMLTVDLVFLITGYTPSGDFIALDNIHNIISFPVGLLGIYSYTMFNVVMNDVLAGNSRRYVGVILLVEFILFDCLRLFFIFLTGTGMLTCVPPFLSLSTVVHLLKNYIKAFLATDLGLTMMKIATEQGSNICETSSSDTPSSMSSLM